MRTETALLMLLLAGCGGGAGAPAAVPAVPVSAAQAEAEITRVVEEALRTDAAGAEGDGVYAPGHVVVADGERRFTYPRFAAMDTGGQVAITSSRVEIGRALAWAYVEYRWLAPQRGAARAGLATFVLAPGRTELPWAILHAHSSTAP